MDNKTRHWPLVSQFPFHKWQYQKSESAPKDREKAVPKTINKVTYKGSTADTVFLMCLRQIYHVKVIMGGKTDDMHSKMPEGEEEIIFKKGKKRKLFERSRERHRRMQYCRAKQKKDNGQTVNGTWRSALMSHSSAIFLWSSSASMVALKFCGAIKQELLQLVTSFYKKTKKVIVYSL